MFKRILIANRGEIALRVIRACRELGIESVAVHSVADANALHVKFADESVCIGPAPAPQSYLHIPAIISAAEVTGAEAIHPGYGFLSENAEFAEMTERCGLKFIGPPPPIMRLMGGKISARKAMVEAGVPILPGTGLLETDDQALTAVDEIGLPVIIKASAGGGGRGMKIVKDRDRLLAQLEVARAEALAGFGSSDVYLERYVEAPRHIEVQVVADGHGGVAILGERECSIQRRHQKLVEEAPSCALSDAEREKLMAVCEKAMRAINYSNVGTMEFLYEGGNFYFMEMNTRIQVEHTVTEMVTGLDLVREQIKLANGERLSSAFTGRFRPRGHAIECRINAEDPVKFTPSPGRITALNLPGGFGVRVDTHIYEGYVVPPNYDSLLAKLIVHAEDRDAAIRRLRRALGEFVVEGIQTNLQFHRRLIEHPDFVQGRLDTHFLERFSTENAPGLA
ncbi:MAG TPA: acetyl-CoA carboxylase biotin carboxylase subunit [Polyangia bacterium]|nr:acetyl-CoA carboxylase biotin carboxylase subunit [Polyangia bacterium]